MSEATAEQHGARRLGRIFRTRFGAVSQRDRPLGIDARGDRPRLAAACRRCASPPATTCARRWASSSIGCSSRCSASRCSSPPGPRSPPKVQTSLGAIPGPVAVFAQVDVLWQDHVREREKAVAFAERQAVRNAELVAEGRSDKVKERAYTVETHLRRPDRHLARNGRARLRHRDADRRAARHRLGTLEDRQRRTEPARAAVQAGLPARLAAARDDGGLRAVPGSGRAPAEVARRLGDHGDAVLALADADQHRARRRLGRQGLDERGGACCSSRPGRRSRRWCCPSALPLIFTGLRLSLGGRLDGAHRRGDALPEPGAREVRLGRVPERLVRLARAGSCSPC